MGEMCHRRKKTSKRLHTETKRLGREAEEDPEETSTLGTRVARIWRRSSMAELKGVNIQFYAQRRS